MNSRLRRFVPGIAAVFVISAVFILWALNPHRKVPLRKVFNPAEWVLHWQGRDHYDAQTALLQEGDTAVPEVALTFDDGPDPTYGPEVAAILKAKAVPATFFLVGMRVKQYPEVARLLARDGFELANHTYNHQDLPALKPHEIANELRLCDQDIFLATGLHTTLMRPPGVQYNAKMLDVTKALGYVTVSWTVGAKDYDKDTNADFIKERILDRTAPGAIILLHQDTPATVAALPAIIDGLRAQGFRFVTVSQMLARLHAKLPVPLTKNLGSG
ncbi:MAG: polysaccharide deacetylase family protein [Janthinobacterium lividum]